MAWGAKPCDETFGGNYPKPIKVEPMGSTAGDRIMVWCRRKSHSGHRCMVCIGLAVVYHPHQEEGDARFPNPNP